jgi:hypothetical protein
MKLQKSVSKPSIRCEGCKFIDKCPYLDKSECFQFNSVEITKSNLEDIDNEETEN